MNLSHIIDGYMPDDETPSLYTIFFPDGEPLTCRRIATYGELMEFDRGAKEFWKRIQDGELAPAAQRYAPVTETEARAVYKLIFHSAEPTKFDEEMACRLLLAPLTMLHLINKIDERQIEDVVAARRKRLEEGKAGSTRTIGSDAESSNRSDTSGDEAPTT